MEGAQGKTTTMREKIFRGLGLVTGKFYNTQQEWSKAPEWVKQHYKIEEEQNCGDITTIQQGLLKGAINAAAEFAKQNPRDAAEMGLEIAKATGAEQKDAVSFARGFFETADFTK